MKHNEYIALRSRAVVVKDSGGYNLNAGEMNPNIFRMLVSEMREREILPVIWEPFAGTSHSNSFKKSVLQDIAAENEFRLISYGLAPKDPRIVVRDSMRFGPRTAIGGMLFHPPYFGSDDFSEDKAEITRAGTIEEYEARLGVVAWKAADAMMPEGLVCAIGRDYRCNGERVRMDLMYLDVFVKSGFELDNVWVSEPDVVLIFRRI